MPAPLTPVDVRVPVPGGELNVAVWGEPGGEPLLALHGITASSRAWGAVAAAAGSLVAPDLRGRGGSVRGGPYGMAAHAADCLAVLDHLGVGRARVVGHSMGAFVAAVLAMRHPARVARLVLVDGGAQLPPVADPEAALGPAAARLRMRFADPLAYRDFWRRHPAFVRWSPAVTAYVDYDLVPDGDDYRSRVVEEAVRVDLLELHAGDLPRAAHAALPPGTPFVRAERGLLDEPVPLYPDPAALAPLDVRTVPGTNHYSVLFDNTGVAAVLAAVAGHPEKER
ncbi:alpha/beta fold hydrolase [Actinophytocola xanthii]|uniref:AB hydrolase-1 domain-containing protein n=1 Tax=Actinophytocola xanthii TaxID=1912961 RepID=A0A1Q8CME3_9PSEU|nr:alpha/beta hydrolase [Actinophytocola xanthii]OLF15521.1 hypothetical protein BU204_21595 [Actinophytocola xanthii]